MKKTMKFVGIFSLALMPLLITGCSNFKSAAALRASAQLPETPTEFVLPNSAQQQQPVIEWWAQFNDAQLNGLVKQSLMHNRTIHIAQASLAESRAYVRTSKLDFYPTVDANLSATRQRQSGDISGTTNARISESYQTGFDASWELDVFGRVRNGVRLSRAQEAARHADLQAAQLSVGAEVAAAYISLRGYQHLLTVAEQNAHNQLESLQLAQRFADVGRGDQLDVARAQAQLELTRATVPSISAQVNTALNRLSVLTGSATPALKTSLAQAQPLPNLPASFAVGAPRDMLQRRPDIRRAEQALIAATADYNIRVADLYPSISFSGGLGYLSSDWTRLGDANTDTFLFAPKIHWAAFNLGRVNAQIAAADARTQVRIAEFEQQVLIALEEADNSLQNFTREEQRRAGLQLAAKASHQAAEIARKKFELGSSDFLSVLDAERAQLDISAQLAQSDMQVLLNLVAIYKALGGGWELAAQEQVSARN